jgi:hypothetical protein
VLCNNRLVNRQPPDSTQCVCLFPQIEGSVKVSIAGVTTVQTLEETCIVGPCREDFTASAASLRAVMGRNDNEYSSLPDTLVFYESPQLGKGPVGKQPVECLPSPLTPDSSQVFHNNNISCIYSADNTLADFVVDAPHKPCLPAGKPLKMFPGRARAFGLELASQPLKSSNMILNSFEKLLFRSGGKIVYPKVNANNLVVTAMNGRFYLFGNCDIQKEFFSCSGKSGASGMPVFIHLKVIIRDMKGLFDSAFDSRKRAFAGKIKGIGAFVVPDRELFGKINLPVSASLFGLKGDLDCLARELGGKLEMFPYLSIGSLMKSFPGIYLMFESMIISKLGSFAELCHSVYGVFGIRNFKAYGSLRNHDIPQIYLLLQSQYIREEAVHFRGNIDFRVAIPPIPEGMGFLATKK